MIPLLMPPALVQAPTPEAPEACDRCGMDRTRFASSRMRLTWADGRTRGTFSLACAAEELREAPGAIRLEVADHDSPHGLMDARRATWVLGGREAGVMTSVAKWAFATPTAARAFIRRRGGRLVPFERALRAAQQEP